MHNTNEKNNLVEKVLKLKNSGLTENEIKQVIIDPSMEEYVKQNSKANAGRNELRKLEEQIIEAQAAMSGGTAEERVKAAHLSIALKNRKNELLKKLEIS